MLFDFKGHCFERDIIMLNVCWYLSYKLSYRDLEEMATERGLEVGRQDSSHLNHLSQLG